LALLEVGAAAGLCLLIDRYAYDYGRTRVPPIDGSSDAPVFTCQANDRTSDTNPSGGGRLAQVSTSTHSI